MFEYKDRIIAFRSNNPDPAPGVTYLCFIGLDGDLVFDKRKFYLLKMPLLNLVFGV